MEKKMVFMKVIPMIFVLLLIITGCGSGDSDAETDGKKVKLTMSAWGNPAEIKVYQRAIDEYQDENPNVEIKLNPVPGDNYEQKLMTQLSGGQATDVFYVGAEYISKLIETGKIANLTEFLEGPESYVKADDFAEGLWGAARKDEQVYGIPVDNNPFLMYYNKKVLKEAGVDKSPQEYFDEGEWNWETFAEITGKLKDAEVRGFVADNGWAHLFSWVWSNGGEMYDDEGNMVLEDNEEAKEAFKYLTKLVENGSITYGGSLPKGQGADAMFMSNQVGFVAAGRWLTPMFSENESLEFDYIPWPTNTGEQMEPAAIATAYISAATDSENLEEAKRFLSFYTSQAGQKARLSDNGNAVPSVNGVDDIITKAEVPEHASYLIDARDIGIVDDKQNVIPGLDSELSDILDLMYLGQQDAETTIKAYSEKAKTMIEEYRNE